MGTIAEQVGQVGPVQVGVPACCQQDIIHHQVHLSEHWVEQRVNRAHHGLPACGIVACGWLDGWPISLQDLTLQVEIAVKVVITPGRDLELQGSTAVRSWLGTGPHQGVINHTYLQAWHALQVQFALGGWDGGLLV